MLFSAVLKLQVLNVKKMKNKYVFFSSFLLDYFQRRSKVIVWSCGIGASNVNNLLINVKKPSSFMGKLLENAEKMIFFEKKSISHLTFQHIPEWNSNNGEF